MKKLKPIILISSLLMGASLFGFQNENDIDKSNSDIKIKNLSSEISIFVLHPYKGVVPSKHFSPGIKVDNSIGIGNLRGNLIFSYFYTGQSDYNFSSYGITKIVNIENKKFYERSIEKIKKRIQKTKENHIIYDEDCVKINKVFSIKNLEINTSKPIFISNNFILEPSIGLEFAEVKRSYNIFYEKFIGKHKNCFNVSRCYGIGPQLGITLQKKIIKNLNLISSLTQSGIVNKTKSLQKKATDFSSITKLNTGLQLVFGEKHEEFFLMSIKYENQFWINEFKETNLGLHGFSSNLTINF